MGETKTTTTYSFSDFPEDVQLCILSFLTPADITNFSFTSKRFVSVRIDNKLWHAICSRRWGHSTQISKWGDGNISYKLLYRTLSTWDNLIGFWRRCGGGQISINMNPPSLLFFEWGSSSLSGFRVDPSRDGSYGVKKTPFLSMTVSRDGEVVNYLDPEGNVGDRVRVNVNFIGDVHFRVEEHLVGFGNGKGLGWRGGEEGEDGGSELGSSPETLELYQHYANRMSPGADRSWRRQRKRERERQGKRRRWETEHFLKIVDSSPTLDRPLQGLWKGINEDNKLEFYLVAYDGVGISCRRVGDLSERLSSCTPVFWTSDPTFIEPPISSEEKSLYSWRVHLQPPAAGNEMDLELPWEDNQSVSGIMHINSSFDLVIPGLEGAATNPWRVEGRIWLYEDGTFGFGFLRDNFIVDLKHIVKNGCLLDTIEHCSSD